MRKTLLLLILLVSPLLAQRERQIEPPSLSEKNFFEQLRNVFGRFQTGDLRRSFDNAQPLKCSTLVSGTGEWRPVAFFNEDRKLGAAYHRSLEEINREIDIYIFKGACDTEEASVQLVSKFPVDESLDRYIAARITRAEVDVNVNAAVPAKYNPRTQGYWFEMPYLYAVQGPAGTSSVYSLRPPRKADKYVTHVTNHWECKSVRSSDVTFQFLICETAVLPRNVSRGSEVTQSFGSYAYFILSDGKEATTSAKLSFGIPGNEDTAPAAPEPEPEQPLPVKDTPGVEGWQIPGPVSKLGEAGKTEFRIRFSPQTWAGKATTPQVLSDQRMTSLDPAKPLPAVDYCVWRPTASSLVSRVLGNEPDEDVAYSLAASESPAAISFDMKTHTGTRLGTLQCVFPKDTTATAVVFERWVAIVGAHLTLEARP